jgi:hypothetical protein
MLTERLSLQEEGLRMAAHPGIVFRDGPAGRRPALAHGPDVWEVARVIRGVQARGGHVIAESAELTGCTPSQIRSVVRHYTDYREEIDDWIRRVDEEADDSIGSTVSKGSLPTVSS